MSKESEYLKTGECRYSFITDNKGIFIYKGDVLKLMQAYSGQQNKALLRAIESWKKEELIWNKENKELKESEGFYKGRWRKFLKEAAKKKFMGIKFMPYAFYEEIEQKLLTP